MPQGRIAAATSVALWVGDNVATADNSEILAGTTITVRGDTFRGAGDVPEPGQADAGFGTDMHLGGSFGSATTTRIQNLRAY